MGAEATYYDRLGVRPDAGLPALRIAYRRRARELHPDLFESDPQGHHLAMALLNEAWATLSDPARRSRYDESVRAAPARTGPRPAANGSWVRPAPEWSGPPRVLLRREAWYESLRVRIRFLADLAGRSAVQSMLLRHTGTARGMWEALVPIITEQLVADVEGRIRAARSAGAAPLDLANAAALVGLRAFADALADGDRRRYHPGTEAATHAELVARAQMVDRMFDALAHELPREVVRALGDAPRISRRLGARR